jgi:tRNA nucleotidyltransferase (CCA-adding enzyme)
MKIYLVGGAVRDKLLGLPIKERDYVVVGTTSAEMLKLGFRQVGKEFPVFLHPKTGEEYALARTERKIKPGYQGFTFDTSTHVTLEEDLLRRDLSINAIAMDLNTHQLIDPYHGQHDIQHKILRHVSPAFAEDPVRILRLGRFFARYAHLGFQVDTKTMALMRKMVQSGEVNALVAERVWKELERTLGEPHPDKFFEVLHDIHALPILFPHLHITGPGIAALKTATTLTSNTNIRFAALLHALPEDHVTQTASKEILRHYSHRYRIPNAYSELALLTALHYPTILNFNSLSAEALLNLFYALDIYRRETRFHHFLTACQAIALSQHQHLDSAWLQTCAKEAKSVDVQPFIRQGFKGNELAHQLKEARLKKIQAFIFIKHA